MSIRRAWFRFGNLPNSLSMAGSLPNLKMKNFNTYSELRTFAVVTLNTSSINFPRKHRLRTRPGRQLNPIGTDWAQAPSNRAASRYHIICNNSFMPDNTFDIGACLVRHKFSFSRPVWKEGERAKWIFGCKVLKG